MFEVHNVHRREFAVPLSAVQSLLKEVGTKRDQLWPRGQWPPMRFPQEGGVGGHGPIRYRVQSRSPAEVRFLFCQSALWSGGHTLRVRPTPKGAVLEHVIEARLTWPGLLVWHLAVRPLHDALLEDALDNAQRLLTGGVGRPAQWSAWVRMLRWGAVRLGL